MGEKPLAAAMPGRIGLRFPPGPLPPCACRLSPPAQLEAGERAQEPLGQWHSVQADKRRRKHKGRHLRRLPESRHQGYEPAHRVAEQQSRPVCAEPVARKGQGGKGVGGHEAEIRKMVARTLGQRPS